MSRGEALAALAADAEFGELVIAEIAAAPFAALLWETPPVSRGTVDRPFECVLVDAPALASVRPEPEVFANAFAGARDEAIVFPNLSGDALLVAPTPNSARDAGAHLATFLRHASANRRQALVEAIARAALAALDDEPLWISTSGLGVAWLHVRLDRRPKYYTYAPYRSVSA